MARLPATGQAVVSLYERNPESEYLVAPGLIDPRECVTTLADAIAGLGLAPLSNDEEQKVRRDLEGIIGCAVQEEARLQVATVQKAIRRAARTLNAVAAGRRVKSQVIGQVEQILHGRQTGLHSAQEISAANEIVTALAGIVGDRDKADAMLPRWTDYPREIAEACRIANEHLDRIVGRSGQPAIDWYVAFTDVLKFIAAKNHIKPTISTDPVTSTRQGRFLDLAGAIEQILPRAMRSPTDEARAQRLRRALRRN
jgi:hypothetical protein